MMGLQTYAAIMARSRYHHETAVGWVLFIGGLLSLIVVGAVFRNVNKRVKTLIRLVALGIIVLSYVADLMFSK